MIYDAIVVGMGPAGVSAAIYLKRAGLQILCLDKAMIGGTLNFIDKVDNYPGIISINGPSLSAQMYKQILDLDIEFKNQNVLDIIDGPVKKVVMKTDEYTCKNVIIATGRIARSLGLEYEEELMGRGISTCALCDGALYKNQDVAVIGGGNSALSEALYLANICKTVYLVHRRDSFRADQEIIDKINNQHNVEKILNTKVISLHPSDGKLESITLENGRTLKIGCMFTYVGYVPGTKFSTSLDIMDAQGYIEVDSNCETKIKGIYAVGDIIKKDLYQIVTATSEGAIAATHIIKNCKN